MSDSQRHFTKKTFTFFSVLMIMINLPFQCLPKTFQQIIFALKTHKWLNDQ